MSNDFTQKKRKTIEKRFREKKPATVNTNTGRKIETTYDK
jgi:hypothetical protein